MLVTGGNVVAYPFMNILIENAETLEYLDAQNHWTANVTQGRHFSATQTALLFAKKEPIGRFNVVCHIPQSGQIINLNHGKGKGAETAVA